MSRIYNLEKLYGKTIVIKYGGSIMQDEDASVKFISDLAKLYNAGVNIVIIHGGGPLISLWLKKLDIESYFVNGLRKTTSSAIEVIEMVLSGNVNKDLSTRLCLAGLPAVGICGKDSNLITAKKKYTHDSNDNPIDIGFVGDIDKINKSILTDLLSCKHIPVISPISKDELGDTYNINADYVAAHIAGSLNADSFIILTDVDGVLRDVDDPSTLLDSVSISEINELIDDKTIRGGMVPKLECCVKAINMGCTKVHLINGSSKLSFIENLMNNNGTIIYDIEEDLKYGTK